MDRNEWQEFFDNIADEYLDHDFTENTLEECDFLFELLDLKPGMKILDVGCGTGRHSVELAKRGCVMTGIDLSDGMLEEARLAAIEADVDIELIQANAAAFQLQKEFDHAICLCEGSFGLLAADDNPMEHHLAILLNINAALKMGGRLVLTCLNGYKMAREYNDEDIAAGRFDPINLIEIHPMPYETADGPASMTALEKGFTPPELTQLHQDAGFKVENIWGGTAGDWGKRPIKMDEIEVMVVSRKFNELEGPFR